MHENRVCIIGCGNPIMGNDGAGILAMHLFEGRFPGVDAIDGGSGGFGLIALMEGYDKVVIVDAMVGIGDRAGDVLTLENPPTRGFHASISHDIGIGDAVAIAKELGYTAEIVTIGIEVGEIQAFSREIDPAVMVGIRVAEEKILAILEDWIDCSGTIRQ